MRYQKLCQAGVFVLGLLGLPAVLADAPVVDINAADSMEPHDAQSIVKTHETQPIVSVQPRAKMISTANLSKAQRLTRLEQQQNNLANMNLPQQMIHLQQELAKVQGELEVQQHDLKLMSEQQRSFYQDLDQRLAKIQKGGWNNAADTSASPITPATPSIAVPTQTAASDFHRQDSAAYQAAFKLLEGKHYNKSFIEFKNYLSDYPSGAYLSNAHYWIGEIYMNQKNTKNAAKEFQRVIRSYPKSSKVPDAKLKLAIIHLNRGATLQAKRELTAIQKQYPKSTAAQLASIRLQQLTN